MPNQPGRDEQLQIIRNFIQLVGRWTGQCSKELQTSCRLSRHELAALRILQEKGPIPVKELAAALDEVSLSTMTRLLDRLSEQHWIERNLDPQDRRSFRITLTPEGEALVSQASQAFNRAAEQMMEGLDPEERGTFCCLLGKLNKRWSKER